MLAILSIKDDFKLSKRDISFIHLNSNSPKDIEIEARPFALALARKKSKNKVFLIYGEKGKIIYDFSI